MHPLYLIGAHQSACDDRFPVDPFGWPGVALEPIPAAVVGTICRACRAALPVFSRSKNSNLSDGTGTAMWSDLEHLAIRPASTKSTYWGPLSLVPGMCPSLLLCHLRFVHREAIVHQVKGSGVIIL